MAHYYSISPLEMERLPTTRLSKMYSAMVSNVALRRVHGILDYLTVNMPQKARDEHINSIFKLVDEKYKTERMVEEEDLKRILSNGGFTANN